MVDCSGPDTIATVSPGGHGRAPIRTAPRAGTATPPWVQPAALGAAAVAGAGVLAIVDPSAASVPLCLLHALTGLDCPMCGSLRAVHALTRFDVAAALDHNVVFTAVLPLLVLGWLSWVRRAMGAPSAEPTRPVPRAVIAIAVGALVTFGVTRNMAPFAWLASEAG